MSECLFCRSQGPFNTVEHIVPQSLGNDTDVLRGIVCDRCQNYLSHDVEQPALTSTPFAFWRTLLGIRTGKGRMPSVDMTPPKGGRIPAFHPLTDSVSLMAHDDGTCEVKFHDPIKHELVCSQKDGRTNLVLAPYHLSVMGRMLGKMGLEYLASTDLERAFVVEFDELRHFVRRGSTHSLWPLYWGQDGEIRDLAGPVTVEISSISWDIECYRFALGQIASGEHVFAFAVGTDLWLICLSHRKEMQHLSKLVQGIEMSCVYYPDGSWE